MDDGDAQPAAASRPEDTSPAAAPETLPRSTQKKLKKLQDAYERRGVVYISRIPPHMKPLKLRHLLESHGDLGRIYLAPEDSALRKKRKQAGGNTGKNFTEGWVEFQDKSVAKRVAATLNGNPIGGKRRSAYHYDLWCMKYLPKFKWDHLTEEITYRNAVREQKLAAEISAAKRERDFYLSRVDKAKAATAITERKRKRQEKDGNSEAPAVGTPQGTSPPAPAAPTATQQSGLAQAEDGKPRKAWRAYSQKQAKPDSASEQAPILAPDVLSLIAGRRRKATS